MRLNFRGGIWKNAEDEVLKAAIMKYGLNNWSRVASLLVRKSAQQCKTRWYEWLDPNVNKLDWTREEDEKLLHLAKLFPNQWRTIAPLVGNRTAHQCLEHYERLLDQAQGKTEEEMQRAAEVRRIRPGEIDPCPETKPAKPDAVDMDIDDKEMLAEARARLANTDGKKAKRKAREKFLEEARRMAALQRTREMKAAGLTVRKTKREKRLDDGVDYYNEIPFETKPALGFYDTAEERAAADDPSSAAAPSENESRKRATAHALADYEQNLQRNREKRLRDRDATQMKKMMETDLPRALDIINRMNEPHRQLQHTALSMPAPELTEDTLQDILAYGKTETKLNSILGSSSSKAVHSSNLLPARQVRPHIEQQVKSGARSEVGASASIFEESPSVWGGRSVVTALSGAEVSREELRARVKQQLLDLPAPIVEDAEIVTEPLDEAAATSAASLAVSLLGTPADDDDEDAEIAAERQAAEKAAERQRQLRQRSLVIQQGVRRPLNPEPFFLNRTKTGVEQLIFSEMAALVLHDAVLYPVENGAAVTSFAPLSPISSSRLDEARRLVAEESLRTSDDGNEQSRLHAKPEKAAMNVLSNRFLYDPDCKQYIDCSCASAAGDLQRLGKLLRWHCERYRKRLAGAVKLAARAQKKFGTLTMGYVAREKSLLEQICGLRDELAEVQRKTAALSWARGKSDCGVSRQTTHEQHTHSFGVPLSASIVL